MKVRIVAATKRCNAVSQGDIIDFSGKMAGICYLKSELDKLLDESLESTIKRARKCLINGHHSVFGHDYVTLILEEIPKILAMILNNIQVYNTSEKSARYTIMQASECEFYLYNKWLRIFSELASDVYPTITDSKLKIVAQENARYLLSVFTPSTTMAYTIGIRDLNYFLFASKNYIKTEEDTPFSVLVKSTLEEFIKSIPNELILNELYSQNKEFRISLFAKRQHVEEFGENYSTNYFASFAQLAQAQRHRTISYEMFIPSEKKNWKVAPHMPFYIPQMLKYTELRDMWLSDMFSVEKAFPQGTLVYVNERGTIEKFILKCTERLCGNVQFEIMAQTKYTLSKYMQNVQHVPELYSQLEPYSKGPRCTFPGWICKNKCMFGPKYALKRII